MLDEPNAGMNPTETDDLLALIRRIRDDLGITIILVAHDIPLVMDLCDRIQVLNFGVAHRRGRPERRAQRSRRSSRPTSGQARHA